MTEPLRIDYEAFARELDALRAEIDATPSHDDFSHLRKIEGWGRLCSGLGYGTAWIAPNPVSAWLIGQGSMVRWTMMAHHVGHRGYDKVPGVPERYTSKGFAQGSRRLIDWFDWIDPEAWAYEHNVLHHYHTGELADPDLVEENTRVMRESSLPRPLRYVVVGFYALSWKWSYYAPNTFQVLHRAKERRAASKSGQDASSKAEAGGDAGQPASKKGSKADENDQIARTKDSYLSAFDLRTDEGRAFWKRCILPYGAIRFIGLPALYAPLGPWAVFSVWANSAMAEAFTNAYTFLVIASNHAGDDLYRFEGKATDRAEFYARQVMGSVNYETGGDLRDFLHGFLNYQIEHHVFPDLPMRRYQQIQPRVKAICEKYGVPYVQEGVFKRAKRLVDIMVGKTAMLRGRTLSRTDRQVALAAELGLRDPCRARPGGRGGGTLLTHGTSLPLRRGENLGACVDERATVYGGGGDVVDALDDGGLLRADVRWLFCHADPPGAPAGAPPIPPDPDGDRGPHRHRDDLLCPEQGRRWIPGFPYGWVDADALASLAQGEGDGRFWRH